MDEAACSDDRRTEVRELLRAVGVPFAFVHGSRATGDHRTGSDLDIAAWCGDIDDLGALSSFVDQVTARYL